MPIVLPHELLHCLDHCGKLRELCDQRDLADYWAHFHSNVSMHVQWPVEAPLAQLAVPLGLHGDDCRYTDTNQKIIILSMNILVDKTQQRFPLVVIRHATRLCNYIIACIQHVCASCDVLPFAYRRGPQCGISNASSFYQARILLANTSNHGS